MAYESNSIGRRTGYAAEGGDGGSAEAPGAAAGAAAGGAHPAAAAKARGHSGLRSGAVPVGGRDADPGRRERAWNAHQLPGGGAGAWHRGGGEKLRRFHRK